MELEDPHNQPVIKLASFFEGPSATHEDHLAFMVLQRLFGEF